VKKTKTPKRPFKKVSQRRRFREILYNPTRRSSKNQKPLNLGKKKELQNLKGKKTSKGPQNG